MSGIGDFLSKETAGMPNWAWGGVVIVGIAAATLLPKLFGNKSSGQTAPGQTGYGGGVYSDNPTGSGQPLVPTVPPQAGGFPVTYTPPTPTGNPTPLYPGLPPSDISAPAPVYSQPSPAPVVNQPTTNPTPAPIYVTAPTVAPPAIATNTISAAQQAANTAFYARQAQQRAINQAIEAVKQAAARVQATQPQSVAAQTATPNTQASQGNIVRGSTRPNPDVAAVHAAQKNQWQQQQEGASNIRAAAGAANLAARQNLWPNAIASRGERTQQ